MPLSSHARTLADIFQRRGDVLARTEMAKHQALAQGLQGVGGALGDWLTQKQETKTQEQQQEAFTQALMAFWEDPGNPETVGPLASIVGPDQLGNLMQTRQKWYELGLKSPSKMKIEDAANVYLANPDDPTAQQVFAGAVEATTGQKIQSPDQLGVIAAGYKEEEKPEKMRPVTTGGRQLLVPESQYPPEGFPVDRPAPKGPAPTRYSPKSVTVEGEFDPVMANYDSATGKYHDVATGEVLNVTGPAPTAQVRNLREAARGLVPMMKNMRSLGESIITRIGPAQRAEALTRGAAAVFGMDPEYRTYIDFRAAMGAMMSVAMQGSRPSDADVFRVAEPMIPNPYEDTAESAKMKWNMIFDMFKTRLSPEMKTMLGLAGEGGGAKESPIITTPDGKRWRREGDKMLLVE